MHAVLHLQADGLDASSDEALEQRLHQTGGSGFLAHDNRPQLAVVSHEHDLLRSENDRYETLGLCSLCALVDENLLEAAGGQARVAGAHARAYWRH